MDQFEVNGDEVFEEFLKIIVLKVSVGRMWYKLPYEDISEKKKLLENGEKNKKRMASNGRYYGELDVFIEKPETSEDDEVDAKLQNDEVDGREVDAELQNDEVDDDDEAEESEDEYQASDKSDDEEDLDINFEEDLEMFRDENYEDEIVDDDETFYSGEEFKKQVIKYILQSRRNVVYDRWEKTKIGAKCSGRGCVWRIHCSVERSIQKWMVKVYVNTHTCHPTGKCKLIKSPAIAEVMLEKIRKEPEMSAPMIREEFREKYNIIISPEQAKIARRIVLDKLQAECNEHFARLKDYEMELLRSNPDSKIEINTITKPNGAKAFHSMYICFDKIRVAWKEYCRPVIGLDGTFLKHSSLQGLILTAIGRDPNNQIYPIAWAVVDSESNDNWQWFIHRLKIDLGLGEGDLVTIISDQHRGLIHGVTVELPRAEHRACARHIYFNLKKNHKSDTLKPLFWRIASSYNEGDYERSLDVFKKFDPLAAEELMKKDRSIWCKAFFRIGSCCSDTHNNFTESFNRTLKIARKKHFIQMLELIRRDAMQRIATRYKTAKNETGLVTKKARKEVEKSCDEAKHCYSYPSTGGAYECVEFSNGYTVNLPSRSCACRKWDLSGIPCRIMYLLSWRCLYMDGLGPVNGPRFWKLSGEDRIEAPPYKRPPGRPKGKARIKGVRESPKKNQTKVDRKGRIGHCGLCGGEGHNSRKCPRESDESRKLRRLNMEQQSHELAIDDVSSTAPPATQP
ncbi:uncharacterized protein LOC106383428 [Brassica napus]|uniref:uncharacterized protein LOC106383428 n=1 Tax=Brassica napus TaxID=3708 RepID=UPI0020797BAF|nr:uncharacterized protein LOC106383428 [Brassica napus]